MASLEERDPARRREAALAVQRTAGNAALQRMLAARREDAARSGARRLSDARRGGALQRAVLPRSAPPPIPGVDEYNRLVREYEALGRGAFAEADRDDADAAMRKVAEATARLRAVHSAGSGAGTVAAGALGAAAVLAADDVTGIGVADDVLIPPALVVAAGAGLLAWALSASAADRERAADAAREAIAEATRTLGAILMAQKLGDKARGQIPVIMIHLARILGTTVSGMPPDHQKKPEDDRPHWWHEVKIAIEVIRRTGLSPKQLWRELSRQYTKERLIEMLNALKEAAKKMGEDPPDFPPIAFP